METGFPIGNRDVTQAESFCAFNPVTGEALPERFPVATQADVDDACSLAAAAFDAFRETDPGQRAAFLEVCAAQIEGVGDAVIQRAHLETGLPIVRLTGELGRTANQLRLFARVVREGHWADVTIDPALPERAPLPRPDLRRRNIAVGPVAVFGASNFPLAFSVAGGDTASALAAGCPVVVKAHPAHPGTSLLVARAIREAVRECELPEGVFSMIQGPAHALGTDLVAHPSIKAVGFTGSRAGGLALFNVANARPEPIPVFAEMSSVNPVLLMPAALAARGDAMAVAYAGSLSMGAGQFCTNPGVVLALAGAALDAFLAKAAGELSGIDEQTMLTGAICTNYRTGLEHAVARPEVEVVYHGAEVAGQTAALPSLLVTSGGDFLACPELAREIFGPVSLVVRCASLDEMSAILEAMEGQLTATLQIDPDDYEAVRALLPLLERKAGRILANGWPTGVEVSHAMVHGGPFPATSDSRTTSVGAAAIDRFLRPVCYQGLPDELLPSAVREDNPYGLPRYVS